MADEPTSPQITPAATAPVVQPHPTSPIHDSRGFFRPGNPGGPGRPKAPPKPTRLDLRDRVEKWGDSADPALFLTRIMRSTEDDKKALGLEASFVISLSQRQEAATTLMGYVYPRKKAIEVKDTSGQRPFAVIVPTKADTAEQWARDWSGAWGDGRFDEQIEDELSERPEEADNP